MKRPYQYPPLFWVIQTLDDEVVAAFETGPEVVCWLEKHPWRNYKVAYQPE